MAGTCSAPRVSEACADEGGKERVGSKASATQGFPALEPMVRATAPTTINSVIAMRTRVREQVFPDRRRFNLTELLRFPAMSFPISGRGRRNGAQTTPRLAPAKRLAY